MTKRLYAVEQLYMQFPPNPVYASSRWQPHHLLGMVYFTSQYDAQREANRCFFPSHVQSYTVNADGGPGWTAGVTYENYNQWLCPYFYKARAITLGMVGMNEDVDRKITFEFRPGYRNQMAVINVGGVERLYNLPVYERAYWENQYDFEQIAQTDAYLGSEKSTILNWIAIPKGY